MTDKILSPADVAVINTPYNRSANIVQSLVVVGEALLLKQSMGKALSFGASAFVASMVPANGMFINNYEKIWETIAAAALGGGLVYWLYDGRFWNDALMSAILYTSGVAVTEGIYDSFILGGINANYTAYRRNAANSAVNKLIFG